MTIHELFTEREKGNAGACHPDMLPHMRQLRDLAAQCRHCTEFGVRTGQSTVAILAGLAANGGKLVSYDICDPAFQIPETPGVQWSFVKGDTTNVGSIEPTELLLVDTLHFYEQVARELAQAKHVARFLAFHDVVINGYHGENGKPGILQAIFDFMAANREWRVHSFHPSQWGLLVLCRA